MFMPCTCSFNGDISGRFYSVTGCWWVWPYFPFLLVVFWWCLVSLSFEMLSILQILIIHDKHFGKKFKDGCQKNADCTEFPHASDLNKTTQVYHLLYSCFWDWWLWLFHSGHCAWHMEECMVCVIFQETYITAHYCCA